MSTEKDARLAWVLDHETLCDVAALLGDKETNPSGIKRAWLGATIKEPKELWWVYIKDRNDIPNQQYQ